MSSSSFAVDSGKCVCVCARECPLGCKVFYPSSAKHARDEGPEKASGKFNIRVLEEAACLASG